MLSIYLTTSALNIPKHDTQLPLLLAHEGHRTQSQNTRVLLALGESESDVEHHVEMPLHTSVFSGVNLPSQLNTMEIKTATEQGQSISQTRLDKVICRITPKTSAEEQEAVDLGMELKVLPWFATRDGTVQVDDSNSRWFLGGRRIERYQCR
ncbi:unnamed protein product [Alternaria burnsii]|nr:unnamed protein product [Alternaria burnsii]